MRDARIAVCWAAALTLVACLCVLLPVFLSDSTSQADAPNAFPDQEALVPVDLERYPSVPEITLNYEYPYETRFTDSEGREMIVDVIPGRPPEIMPDQMLSGIEADTDGSGPMRILDVPSFDWCYGCSATSAAMMFGYYDYSGYPSMYTGPQNGGVCPQTNDVTGWGAGECPLSATHQGYDNLSVRGHVDDYYYYYGSTVDPYYGNWTEHGYADCTADYMGTNQWHNWNNAGGSTTFFYLTNGNPLCDYSGNESWPVGHLFRQRDGAHGMTIFVGSRGYTVTP